MLKDQIEKIDKVYKPAGYRISISVGKLGGENSPHFYMQIVPKYRENWGTVGSSSSYHPAIPEQIETSKEAFQPNADNIIAERDKIIARLHNDKHLGYTTISTKKHLPNDIKSIDSEIWSEIGEILQELMAKFEDKLECYDFTIGCQLGEKAEQMWKKKKNEEKTFPITIKFIANQNLQLI